MANQMAMKWQDWVTLVVGVWLLFSPWLLGFYTAIPAASWNFFMAGFAFAIFAAVGLNLRTAWEEWVNMALGIWMIASPWVLGYRGTIAARDDAVIVGLVVAVMAVWTLAERHTAVAVGNQSLTH
ncbi:MAG TPA: SPW repeat protein [Casimicrobiaceae bacterium]